jgi:hypothetical protein
MGNDLVRGRAAVAARVYAGAGTDTHRRPGKLPRTMRATRRPVGPPARPPWKLTCDARKVLLTREVFPSRLSSWACSPRATTQRCYACAGSHNTGWAACHDEARNLLHPRGRDARAPNAHLWRRTRAGPPRRPPADLAVGTVAHTSRHDTSRPSTNTFSLQPSALSLRAREPTRTGWCESHHSPEPHPPRRP